MSISHSRAAASESVESKCSSGNEAGSSAESPAAAVEIVHLDRLPGIPCPCGTARRAFLESTAVPFSLHLTHIAATSRVHYHRHLTETYFVLECEPGAYIELNGEQVPLEPNMAILIPPLTRHRAVGNVKVVIVAQPKFDPADEWFDD